MDYELDQGAGAGLRPGLIVLSTDMTLEFEARQVLAGREANLLHSRIASAPQVTPDSLKDMEGRITASAGLLPEGMSAIGYGCTSASVLIGPEAVARQVRRAHPGVPVTNPISAVLAALEALGAGRIALVTPYAPEVAAPMRQFLAREGVETLAEIGFGEGDDRRVARITEDSTLAAVLEAGRAPGVEAVFASCTNLRSFGLIEEAEARLGRPVISSNLALLWHLLALAGARASGWGPGRLFHTQAHPRAA